MAKINFTTALEAVTEAQRAKTMQATAAQLDTRAAFERKTHPANSKKQAKLKAMRAKLVNTGVAGVMVAAQSFDIRVKLGSAINRFPEHLP